MDKKAGAKEEPKRETITCDNTCKQPEMLPPGRYQVKAIDDDWVEITEGEYKGVKIYRH